MGYHLTTGVGDRTLAFQQAIDDPFVHTTIHIGWRDLLRGLLRGSLTAHVIVGADRDTINAVMTINKPLSTEDGHAEPSDTP